MTGPFDALDAYLTRKARRIWPGAEVCVIEGRHVLRRTGHSEVILGTGGIGEARRALAILREGAEHG